MSDDPAPGDRRQRRALVVVQFDALVGARREVLEFFAELASHGRVTGPFLRSAANRSAGASGRASQVGRRQRSRRAGENPQRLCLFGRQLEPRELGRDAARHVEVVTLRVPA